MRASSSDIAVIGAGLMGHSIAFTLAAAGHQVRVFDRCAEELACMADRLNTIADLLADDSGAVARVTAHHSFYNATTDTNFVIESADENLDIKQFIIAELEASVSPETIIASNTAGLPIASNAAKAFRPERIVGAHFFTPPHLEKMVEVVQTEHNSMGIMEETLALLTGASYQAVHVKRDTPDFFW